MKLNVGCGTDYREGWWNVDGADVRVDEQLDITPTALLERFQVQSCTAILCNDFLEHHYLWVAEAFLKAFRVLVRPDGRLELRVPDCERIIAADRPIEWKLRLLYGGQSAGGEREADRAAHPEYFCHRYGWTLARLTDALARTGWDVAAYRQEGWNFCVNARPR